MARTDYKNYIPPVTGRKFSMTNNADGTVSLTDVTQYAQTGDIWGAGDANDFGAEINKNTADIATKAAKSAVKTAELTVSGWVGATAPYTQTVAVSDVTMSTNALADFEHANNLDTEAALADAWACISFFAHGNGTVTATCLESLPAIDIPLRLIVLG